MENMLNESFNNEDFSPFMSAVFIALILKPGNDPTKCGSKRPNSLLNLDTEIIVKVLASRFSTYLLLLIIPDQNGL